jgi:hypothetical protein
MLDLGSTSFVISPEAAKAFSIPEVTRTELIKARDFSCSNLKTVGLFTIPLRVSFGSHHSYDENDHTLKVMQTSADYDTLLPASYLEKHKA